MNMTEKGAKSTEIEVNVQDRVNNAVGKVGRDQIIHNYNYYGLKRYESTNELIKESNMTKTSVNNEGKPRAKKRLAFTIVGSIEEVDEHFLQIITTALQEKSEDAFLKILAYEESSIRLILEGSEEGLKKLETLFNSGELTEVLEIPVEDVYFLDTEALNSNPNLSFPLVGKLASDFTATAVFDQEFKTIKLSDYRGKYVVLLFYHLDFTFVCPTEITAFSDRYSEFSQLNTEVLGVSVDSEFSHLAWIQTDRQEGGVGDVAYPLVSDIKKEISSAYNVLDPEAGVALRGLFIIDKEGVIQYATTNNLSFGRSVDETLRVLKAIQYIQTRPDVVVPAGWQEGDKTMIPDLSNSEVGLGASASASFK